VRIDLRAQRLQFGTAGVEHQIVFSPLLPQLLFAKADILQRQARDSASEVRSCRSSLRKGRPPAASPPAHFPAVRLARRGALQNSRPGPSRNPLLDRASPGRGMIDRREMLLGRGYQAFFRRGGGEASEEELVRVGWRQVPPQPVVIEIRRKTAIQPRRDERQR